jgi:plastocyanin
MHQLSRSICLGIAVFVPTLLVGCNDKDTLASTTVSMRDNCEPTSFNAALGAGTCTGTGTMTFAQFNSELNATQKVAAWQFVPATFAIKLGQAIAVMNNGGEVHTFTKVAQFGGGEVAALNSASGNPVEAPECMTTTAADHVSPGLTFRTDASTTMGTAHYQCCIHPWMRANVTVE